MSLHTSLGLGLVRGEVAVVAPLTSHKDHELLVISKEVTRVTCDDRWSVS